MKLDRRLKFINFVYTSLLRQSLHSRSIPKFELSLTEELNRYQRTTPQLKHKLSVLINRCMRLGIQYGVKELALEFPYYTDYPLPKVIFFSAKQLVVCRLAGCIINSPTINWPSLHEFSLNFVEICDQRIIDNLTFTCPFIDKFVIDHCSGLDYLTLSGLKRLKKVKVKWTTTKKIEVDALSLQTLSFYGPDDSAEINPEINITACKNLKVLKFKYTNFTDGAVQDIISRFPALELLVLYGNEFESIKISNQRLEKLKLSSDKMVETIIDAPRLKSLEYFLGKIPSLVYVNATSLHGADLQLFRRCRLLELNKFLSNFNQIKLVHLYIPYEICCGVPEIVGNISSPIKVTDINILELDINLKKAGDHAIAEAAQEALVDGLFWTYHPKSLLIVSGSHTNNEFMKFLCKKLVLREEEQHYCAAVKLKCWRHDLKGFNIEHCRRNGGRNALTCDALLDSLQTIVRDEKIYFVFKW